MDLPEPVALAEWAGEVVSAVDARRWFFHDARHPRFAALIGAINGCLYSAFLRVSAHCGDGATCGIHRFRFWDGQVIASTPRTKWTGGFWSDGLLHYFDHATRSALKHASVPMGCVALAMVSRFISAFDAATMCGRWANVLHTAWQRASDRGEIRLDHRNQTILSA
jgi:hypothetical protein